MKAKILVVDDEVAILRATKNQLMQASVGVV